MKIGMLWYNDTKSASLQEEIEAAADHYFSRYGRRPEICFVHPITLEANPVSVPGITILGKSTVLPNHLFLGMSNDIPVGED
jgi:hypothetical protein